MEKLRTPIIRLLVIALCLGAVFALTQIDVNSRNVSDNSFMYATVDRQRINVYEHDGEFYLFLPGYIKDEDVVYSPEARNHDIKVMKSANIATIYITTKSGNLDGILADKSYKEIGSITVVNEDGSQKESLGLDYLKGRGNYSWNNWAKKPFKFQLSRQMSLLGLENGKDYALIANASDATLIRNDIARNLEKAVGIPYARTGKFTDLYINGDYMGNYYLCSSIEVGSDNIDITDIEKSQEKVFAGLNEDAFKVYETPVMKGWNLPDCVEDITGGYLVEREFVDRYNLEYSEMRNGFETPNEEHYIVLSPKFCTVKEINYIADFFEKAENEIMGDDAYGQYIDLPSFAKRYLVEEVLKNYDGGVSSAYYYKDRDDVDPKLYAGPGWDFDMCLGNYLDWMEYYSEGAGGITELYLSHHSCIYYKNMLKHEEFNALVHEYYEEDVLEYMHSLINGGIDEYRQKLSASAEMDSVRWADMYKECGYTTADQAKYDELSTFIEERISFLSGEWLE